MSKKTVRLQTKKLVACCVHFLFVLVALIGISMMYLNDNFGKGITWISDETYEDTRSFYSQLQRDIKNIFEYVHYRDVFETDGKIDFTKPMLDLTFGPGDERSYTLEDLIQYTKSRGYFLNDNYVLSGTPTTPTEEDLEKAYVDWKAYAVEENPEVESYATLEELSKEVLQLLGNYYSICNRLLAGNSNLYFTITYQDSGSQNQLVYTNAPDKTLEDYKKYGQYTHLSGESAVIDTNMNYRNFSVSSYLSSSNPFEGNSYSMIMALDTTYPFHDTYRNASLEYTTLRDNYIFGLVLMMFGCGASLFSLLYLVCKAGRKNENDKSITLSNIDKPTTEAGLLALLAATMASLYLCRMILVRIIHLLFPRNAWPYTEQLAYSVIIYFCILIGVFSLIRRYKAGTIWSNSALRKAMKGFSKVFTSQSFTFLTAVYFLGYLGCNCLLILIGLLFLKDTSGTFRLTSARILLTFAAWLAVNLWALAYLYRNAMQRDKINEAILHLSEGDTAYQVNVDDFSGKEQENAANINHLSEGLDQALKEQVKSERLKADLITNVSHDIKTPLTSIINYVDLLKREQIKDPKIAGFLEVLDQKSQRLKTLTEDLVEASKASSGNLKLEISQIDLVELIWQTNGEFDEKFRLHKLELVTELPDTVILIEADGRRLWRVLENLYNNAFKYAMEGSRVYVDVTPNEDATTVTFTMKNISSNSLNIRADELTERFVRGDVARATEGSGLGLSIAKSLTELQNGKFEIYIDGDLFKVQVTFPVKTDKTLIQPN